jgi:acetyl esterase/lipase
MKEKICNIEENMTFLIDLYKTVFESYQNISLFGDSAGGQLALSLAQQTKKLKLSPPKNIFLFSPLLSIQYDEHFDHYFELDKILSKELVFTIRS